MDWKILGLAIASTVGFMGGMAITVYIIDYIMRNFGEMPLIVFCCFLAFVGFTVIFYGLISSSRK